MGQHDRNQHCIEHKDQETAHKHFVPNLSDMPFRSLYSDMFRVSTVFNDASQQSKLWRNLMANKKHLSEISRYFCIRLKCD